MRLDYDLDANALYIRLTEMPVATTDTIDDETLVDVDETGAPVGIEILGICGVDVGGALRAVLERYEFSAEDELQLRALFPAATIGMRQVKIESRTPAPLTATPA
ncbi:DUF2283 domain-containing protein [Thermopolyspora sp. NPDC052614]|uniref:DUF2283 domain-containing protein n=1 Tax=Thermopolyspora sp. NPDC052614 TaxID=3155682 RepID=UPI00343FD886